jgi:hypothetical protein
MTYNDLAQIPLSEWIQIAVAIVTPLIARIWFLISQKKPKLMWTARHGFTFLVPNATASEKVEERSNQVPAVNAPRFFNIDTIGFYFHNAGRAPVRNMELIFNYRPEHFEFWPPIMYTEKYISDNRFFVIQIDNLGPKVFFNLELLGQNEIPRLIRVTSDEGDIFSKEFSFEPKPHKALIALLLTLISIGLATTAYFATGILFKIIF